MVEDLRVALEDWFGRNGSTIPATIEDVVKKGEEKLDERIKMLKLADKGGWEAVDAYVTSLCVTMMRMIRNGSEQ